MFAPRALRLARVAAPVQRSAFVATTRAFSASRIVRAEESGADNTDATIEQLREKIAAHEGARDAIMKLGELMTSKGVDTTKPPSTTQLLKLGMDADIREAGKNLMLQLQAAGIEMNPQTASQIFSKVVKDEEEPKKDE